MPMTETVRLTLYVPQYTRTWMDARSAQLARSIGQLLNQMCGGHTTLAGSGEWIDNSPPKETVVEPVFLMHVVTDQLTAVELVRAAEALFRQTTEKAMLYTMEPVSYECVDLTTKAGS